MSCSSYLRFLASLDARRRSSLSMIDPAVFADFDVRCPDGVDRVRVDRDLTSLANGKVAGVLTGLTRRTACLVIADDDVRYNEASLTELVEALDRADIVRPQNFFALAVARPPRHRADVDQSRHRRRLAWHPRRPALRARGHGRL